MMKLGLSIFGRGSSSVMPPPRARLTLGDDDRPIYAIGDVHGCLDALRRLEAKIVADAATIEGRKLIVMLGDYVDRGPESAGVIDHLLEEAPAGFDRICLAGNHEQLMLDVLEGRAGLDRWRALGSDATLASYGIDSERLLHLGSSSAEVGAMIAETVPAAHLAFLRDLPVLLSTRLHIFVHAGLRPDVPVSEQSDRSLMSLRLAPSDATQLPDRYIVHGHTPVARVAMENRRINVDTGACFTGRLSALRIWRGGGRVLST
jgi:serine/threonine protein phosphatase 1